MLPNLEEKLDPRVKRTRKYLEAAFKELLEEKGFQAVTVQDITERAEVNRATFYAHFPDKYALLDHVVRKLFQQELEKRMLNVCSFSMDNLRLVIIAVCEFTHQTNGHCSPAQPQFESLVETQIKDILQQLLEHWISGDTDSSDAKIASIAASWAVYGLALQWGRNKARIPVEDFADKVLPLIAANLQQVETA